MQNKNNQTLNLFIALGKFINAMRLFISSELQKEHGASWGKVYAESLLDIQKDVWIKNVQEGVEPSQLIDFGNLNSFAIRQKRHFFSKYFGRESNNLPTIFNQMAEARNNLAHYLPFDRDKAEKAFLHMIDISKKLEMYDLEADLRKLKSESFNSINNNTETQVLSPTKSKPEKNNTGQRFKKIDLIQFISKNTAIQIDKSKTNLSTINSNDKFSVEPNFKRINYDWFLILVNSDTETLYTFKIPSNHGVYKKLYERKDKQVYRLIFKTDDLLFEEELSNERFDRFLVAECQYKDDDF